jgi:uncharacterized membrane protein HdeD (DUF308 family)
VFSSIPTTPRILPLTSLGPTFFHFSILLFAFSGHCLSPILLPTRLAALLVSGRCSLSPPGHLSLPSASHEAFFLLFYLLLLLLGPVGPALLDPSLNFFCSTAVCPAALLLSGAAVCCCCLVLLSTAAVCPLLLLSVLCCCCCPLLSAAVLLFFNFIAAAVSCLCRLFYFFIFDGVSDSFASAWFDQEGTPALSGFLSFPLDSTPVCGTLAVDSVHCRSDPLFL